MLLLLLNNLFTQILMNGEFISKDAINKSASFSHIILSNSKLTFKVKSLEIWCRNKGTRNFNNLKVYVLRVDNIGFNLGKLSKNGLFILDDQYMTHGSEPFG